MIGKVIIDALGCARSLNVNENTHISLAAIATVHWCIDRSCSIK